MNNRFTILLTGCISPNGMKYTSLQDSLIREKQYYDAIRFYLKETSLNIVFCENSNKTSFAENFKSYQDAGRYEFLTFDGNSFDRNKGKGYGEALIIKHALNNSKLINKESSLIKITGRIIISNIKTILLLYKRKNYLYIQLNNNVTQKSISSRFFIAPTTFFTNYFIPNMTCINDSDGYYFEHLLYDQAKRWKEDKRDISDMALAIKYEGISGTTGEHIRLGKFPYIKSILFYLYRKFLLHNKIWA